jgi:hypothetical protein
MSMLFALILLATHTVSAALSIFVEAHDFLMRMSMFHY